MASLIQYIEAQVRVPVWLFLLVASKFGYDIIAMFGVVGS